VSEKPTIQTCGLRSIVDERIMEICHSWRMAFIGNSQFVSAIKPTALDHVDDRRLFGRVLCIACPMSGTNK